MQKNKPLGYQCHCAKATKFRVAQTYLQVSHDAEALGLLQAAGGVHAKLVRAADQQVPGGGVATSLSAHVRELRQQLLQLQLLLLLGPHGTPESGCREERRRWERRA